MSQSKSRLKYIVKRVKEIQKESEKKGDKGTKYITDSCRILAKAEDKRLKVAVDRKTGKLTSEPICSYRYYAQLMNDYRNGVKALGFKHHAIERNIKAFINKYGSSDNTLKEKLNPSQPIQKLRDNIIILRSDAVTGSEFRKDLLNIRIEHHSYYMFEAKGAIKDWKREKDKESLKEKINSQISINPNYIKKVCSELLTSNSPSTSDLAVGLTIATGRRITEVMKTATIKAVDDNTLLFSGQLKMKNRHLFEEIKPYEIPSLINASIVEKSLNELRLRTKNEHLTYENELGETIKATVSSGDIKNYNHNKAVQKKYESTLNRRVRSIFHNGGLSLKDCRALYTEITYSDYANEGETRSAYRHRVLGHSLIETQLHYDSFKINENVRGVKVAEAKTKVTKKEKEAIQQSPVMAYIESKDKLVADYRRAPKILVIHEWLKVQVLNGLPVSDINQTYIRRYCLVQGKQINLNTIKTYLNKFLLVDQIPVDDQSKDDE